MRDNKRRPADMIAVDSHNETRPAHRIAGGVMFDAPLDQPSTSRSTRAGRAKAEARAPTAKLPPAKSKRKSPIARAMLDHISPKGTVTRE